MPSIRPTVPTLRELYERASAFEDRAAVVEWVLGHLKSLADERDTRIGDRRVRSSAVTQVMADIMEIANRYRRECSTLWESRSLMLLPESEMEEGDAGGEEGDGEPDGRADSAGRGRGSGDGGDPRPQSGGGS